MLKSLLLTVGFAALMAPAFARAEDDTTLVAAVQVNARLNAARDQIQPGLGASVYTVDSQAIQSAPGGENVALNTVILQAPGVAQDSFGQLHVRGEHNGLQFRLNGVILPEGLSVFGQALSPRLAGKVALITGALPAQYGLRTAGIVDISTKSKFDNAGAISLYGGSHGEVSPSLEYGGGDGVTNGFVSASWRTSDLGVESPDGRSTPLHDHTDQVQGFGYLERAIDDQSRVSMILGSSVERFQIPNRPGLAPDILVGPATNQPLNVNGQTAYPSGALNETQKEITHYAVASYLKTTDRFTGQLSVFARYSSLAFAPDPSGTLLYNGISQAATKEDAAGGVQAEGVYKLNDAHTARAGLIATLDRSSSKTTSQVIALSPSGAEVSSTPETIVDNGASTARTISLYLQDEWTLTDALTLNYGLRYDRFEGRLTEDQVSPRVNLVWKEDAATTWHAGYARYFSPPPFELVASATLAKFANTTAAAVSGQNDPPKSERANYFDIGVEHTVLKGLTVGLDTYYKKSRNLVDEGQFGAPIILTPFNYADGLQYGAELSVSYNRGPLQTYGNLAYGVARGRNIVSSQFNFDPAELAYIRTHYIYLDHAQRYTGSAGASYRLGAATVSGDLIYGSGLRRSGDIPNGRAGAPYTVVNLSAKRGFELGMLGQVDVRLDLINAFDKIYEIRDGTGVGVGAPQFGARRGLFIGIRKAI